MSGFLCAIPVISALFNACAPVPPFATGYVEGEYVLIAPVAVAQIEALSVKRGDRVEAGQPLAAMERRDAAIALNEAEASEAQSESQLANLREGRRPEEIKVIEATLASAKAQLEEAERAKIRIQSLAARGAATTAQADDVATTASVAQARMAEAEANLAVAKLPARSQEIAAAEAVLAGARAAKAKAEWNLSKRSLTAPAPGVVNDVIRDAGEIAGPSAPVLSMLPDGAVKLRLYVPEPKIAGIGLGTRLRVHCDGCAAEEVAVVTYISDAPEFTPPVIYSLQNRQTLVFLIEARPEEGSHALKPGQIVDVALAGTPG
jgi:HlyD family secretion protein